MLTDNKWSKWANYDLDSLISEVPTKQGNVHKP